MRNVNSVLIGRFFTIVEINACLKERETTTQPLALASSSTRGWRSHPVYREGAGGQGLLPYSRVRRYITSLKLIRPAGTADGLLITAAAALAASAQRQTFITPWPAQPTCMDVYT